ncbi:hypothetical protein J1N35_004280 [Gossypium stocksii]|uniref:Aminotransferase-like plant mobile domain-containing protein n=1 Tax=Gossypium stocksii TaxID=47602 RepID=A0A9D3WD89_9ROSI|nr:hypothetical protein J1N35_004280 [Gossypium stocksii]
MVVSLIRFDDKHISATQLVMVDDHILEGFIHNMGKPAILEICGHLQAFRFLHASRMFGGCKLDLQLISALVERWKPETHTFHLQRGKCTITLEGVALQLGLTIDGLVITGLAKSLCQSLLGKISNKFESGRMSMN